MIYILLTVLIILFIAIVFRMINTKNIVENEYERILKKRLESAKSDVKYFEKRNNDLKIIEWQANNEFLIRKLSLFANKNQLKKELATETNIFDKEFNFNPKDIRFVGRFVDLIIFDGSSDEVEVNIYFIDVENKKNTSYRNYHQKIKKAILSSNYSWHEINV
jgi:predicted Holliday junction resolvase-like endonuclease